MNAFGSTRLAYTEMILVKPGITSDFLLNMAFTAIFATSSGRILNFSAILFKGFIPAHEAKPVSTGPGLKQVTEMEVWASSKRKARVNDKTKAFVAE